MQFDDRVRKDIRQALIYPLFLLAMVAPATLFIFSSWFRGLPRC